MSGACCPGMQASPGGVCVCMGVCRLRAFADGKLKRVPADDVPKRHAAVEEATKKIAKVLNHMVQAHPDLTPSVEPLLYSTVTTIEHGS